MREYVHTCMDFGYRRMDFAIKKFVYAVSVGNRNIFSVNAALRLMPLGRRTGYGRLIFLQKGLVYTLVTPENSHLLISREKGQKCP